MYVIINIFKHEFNNPFLVKNLFMNKKNCSKYDCLYLFYLIEKKEENSMICKSSFCKDIKSSFPRAALESSNFKTVLLCEDLKNIYINYIKICIFIVIFFEKR